MWGRWGLLPQCLGCKWHSVPSSWAATHPSVHRTELANEVPNPVALSRHAGGERSPEVWVWHSSVLNTLGDFGYAHALSRPQGQMGSKGSQSMWLCARGGHWGCLAFAGVWHTPAPCDRPEICGVSPPQDFPKNRVMCFLYVCLWPMA